MYTIVVNTIVVYTIAFLLLHDLTRDMYSVTLVPFQSRDMYNVPFFLLQSRNVFNITLVLLVT